MPVAGGRGTPSAGVCVLQGDSPDNYTHQHINFLAVITNSQYNVPYSGLFSRDVYFGNFKIAANFREITIPTYLV